MESGLPFSDIRRLFAALPSGSEDVAGRVERAFASQRGAGGDLGDLERLAVWLARWSGKPPAVRQPLVAIFAATHGFAAGMADGAAVAVELVASGKAPVSALCAATELGLKVFDLALDVPTVDFTRGEALSERDCAATIAFGMESIAGGVDLISLADIGGDADRSAEAVLRALEGPEASEAPDTPSPVVLAALRHHGRHLSDPLEIARRVGGREIAAIAGAVLAARIERIPVVLDGLSSIAAAAVLHAARPGVLDHCLLAIQPEDPVAARATKRMRLSAITCQRLASPGAAGALAIGTLKSAAVVAQQIFAFAERGRADGA